VSLFAIAEKYPLAIALEDFVPVVFTAIGCFFLVHMVGRFGSSMGKSATVGSVLAVTGGGSKAVWKLIRSFDGPDLKWLAGALFPLLASGFGLLAWTLWHHERAEHGEKAWGYRRARKPVGVDLFRLPLAVAAIGAVTGIALSAANDWNRSWRIPLLALMTVGDLATITFCIRCAARSIQRLAIVAFVVNILSVFGLTRLARFPNQTLALQWTEQSINTVGTACWAWACWKISSVRKSI
jgi:cytochrome bd-type quinol oxidase subunit 2